jgi:hypothetical protein
MHWLLPFSSLSPNITKMRSGKGKKGNCPNITACVDVRSLVPGESGTKDTHTCDRTQ